MSGIDQPDGENIQIVPETLYMLIAALFLFDDQPKPLFETCQPVQPRFRRDEERRVLFCFMERVVVLAEIGGLRRKPG